MADTASNRLVLVIGLDPYRVPGPWDPKLVAEAVETGMPALADCGFYSEACFVGLDGSDEIESRVTIALQSRLWDCVIVGGGIRHSDEHLELFEAVVNLIRGHAPQAAIAFNRTPHDLGIAVTRSLQNRV